VSRGSWRLARLVGIPWTVSGLLLAAILIGLDSSARASAGAASFPTFDATQQDTEIALCRFGVGATDNISNYDIAPLHMGWYVNWTASSSPQQPNGMQYVPMIRLTQVKLSTSTYTYTYSPSGTQLQLAIANNPGAVWLIGNEPDRPGPWQDDCYPHIYAQAYHELYYLIKATDPTAKVFAGGIVQATEIRLQYLDLVLSSYKSLYGESLPTDGWNIHGFVLNEVDCDYAPLNCSGAEIPSGVSADFGEILTIDDNDNFDLFKERIERFRQWMADRGYRGLPVNLSEYGINMPPDYGFPPARVNAFMTQTFDYLLTATNPELGDPTDGYRLVQRWAWWSLSATYDTNGWLFDPTTYARTAHGDQWVTYTSQLSATIDLYPVRVFADPSVPFSQGENVTFTLKALVANSGNISSTQSITIRFYDGDPGSGGVQIGADQVISPLLGCGGNRYAQVEWSNVPTGTHAVYASVDPTAAIAESNELNNVMGQTILVATHRAFLPHATNRASD
jgi:hypothetical protein